MKSIITLFSCAVLYLSSYAQNEPELLQEFTPTTNQVSLVNIDHDMPKLLVKYGQSFELYNLDYSLMTAVTFPPGMPTNSLYLFYVTRSFFDCDTTQIEYMLSYHSTDGGFVKILHEDGTEFFSLEGFAHYDIGSINADPTVHKVVSDELGSYIIFKANGISESTRQLYRLCGQLPQMSMRNSSGEVLGGKPSGEGRGGFRIYPNPAQDQVRLEYDLQGHKRGQLQLFNTSGQLLKELQLGQAFNSVLLDVSDLPQGTYIARIVSEDGWELSEKLVKVD